MKCAMRSRSSGIGGVTVTEVRGHGKQKGHTAVYRGKEYNVNLLPKMEVEVVVDDNVADDAIKAIIQAARTGEIGDGRVFVLPVLQSYRIRTGELGRLGQARAGSGLRAPNLRILAADVTSSLHCCCEPTERPLDPLHTTLPAVHRGSSNASARKGAGVGHGS